MDPLAAFPPQVLRDYALLADGERGALIGPQGDLAWLCVPRWDSDAVFSTLIGGAGCYALTPLRRFTWGGYYSPRSLIWNSRWVTEDGIVESKEALAMPGDPQVVRILRRISALDTAVRLSALLDVRAGFGAEPMRDCHRSTAGDWTGRSGPLWFRWSGATTARRRGAGPLVGELEIAPGGSLDLVLELSDSPLNDEVPDPNACWSATEAAWRAAVPMLDDSVLGPRDAEMSIAVLSGLT